MAQMVTYLQIYNLVSFNSSLIAEAAILEKTIDGDSEQPQRQGMSQMEEHLIVSSFHKLGLACHREAVEARLALLAGPGQSFLSRQRQPAARKSMGVAYKTK